MLLRPGSEQKEEQRRVAGERQDGSFVMTDLGTHLLSPREESPPTRQENSLTPVSARWHLLFGDASKSSDIQKALKWVTRPLLVGWRPSLVRWSPALVGWRPSIVGCHRY